MNLFGLTIVHTGVQYEKKGRDQWRHPYESMLVAILAKTLFTLVHSHLVTLMLLTVWHSCFLF